MPPTLFELPDGTLGSIVEQQGRYSYRTYNVEALNAHLCRWITYMSMSSKGSPDVKSAIDPQLVKAYMGAGVFPGIPSVRRMAPAPVVGSDLSIGWDTGYFAPAQTFITESMERPEWVSSGVLDTAGSEQQLALADLRQRARISAQSLLNWFTTFAFEDRRSAADCLAMALTPWIVSFIPNAVVPGCIFSANKEGSGKTTCAQLISIMATGQETPPNTWPSEGQMRSTITTLLKGGSVISLFDNVKTNMDNDGLEALLTSRLWRDRKFHTQDNLELPNDTMWLFTKNSPDISPDLLRRLVLVPMDKFKDGASPWDSGILYRASLEHKAIQQHMVNVLLAWRYSGAKQGASLMSGFETWSSTIAGIFDEVHVTGFLEAREVARHNIYTEDEDYSDILERLYSIMGDTVWNANDLWNACNPSYEERALDMDSDLQKDKAAIAEWLRHNARGTNINMSGGKKLAALNGRKMEGTPIVLRRLHGNKARYRLEPRDSDGKIDFNEQLQRTGII